ncbi:MAG: hypothetical protein FD187_2817 [bacterium]|nr:MAG: hypothetical protein FD142_2646 [bacterium]KAF0147370.1 MAG: hypothetical protein FD187_2817 [bacterium]KAF0167221.1 MAG: hypothetical protein FD158_2469 [bacterium]TXT19224.1 MAG: hypothetical protein FD132_1824 [bacterium]
MNANTCATAADAAGLPPVKTLLSAYMRTKLQEERPVQGVPVEALIRAGVAAR